MEQKFKKYTNTKIKFSKNVDDSFSVNETFSTLLNSQDTFANCKHWKCKLLNSGPREGEKFWGDQRYKTLNGLRI